MPELIFNDLKNNIFLVKEGIKKKGKDYGVLKLSKKEVNDLMEAINLISSSGDISPKFSQKLQSYLLPRYTEIYETCYTNKSLPDELSIEFSKENVKEIMVAIKTPSSYGTLGEDALKNLAKLLNNIKWQKA
ncbi:MAG: hypothetical protein ACFE8G_04310 [Candidatus Hermodarchaeota archaeon]